MHQSIQEDSKKNDVNVTVFFQPFGSFFSPFLANHHRQDEGVPEYKQIHHEQDFQVLIGDHSYYLIQVLYTF